MARGARDNEPTTKNVFKLAEMRTSEPPTAEELLARVAEGHDNALGELYDRFAPSLLGMLLRILTDRSAAEEVLQDVFVRVANDARRLGKERGSVSAALVLQGRALALDRLRAQRRLAEHSPAKPELLPKSYSWLPRPEEVTLVDGRRSLFQKVINQLPKPQREMLELALFDGHTEAEIALKLGEPGARVRSGLLAGASFIRHRLAAVMRTWAANI
jgi:RNA polymerase sigma-70 factor (ECF subfamily)